MEHYSLRPGKFLKQMHLNTSDSQYSRNLIIDVVVNILEI